ncbi:MAG TPA: PEP-CTERM sorting domain-containing protein [Vicinamibacterales bacterium]|nr:PEP-CTERM sorting domain-containing protein [Vicinamibacterales bacterium]
MKKIIAVLPLLVVLLFNAPGWGAPVVESGSGTSAAAITSAVDTFRADLGGGNVAGANGSFGGVRREINWDGVPDALSAPNNLPANFFNVNSPRGAVFETPGTGFQVSANAGIAPVEFGNIDPSYTSTFAVFSPQRLFTALGSNVVDVLFFVPGTNIPAAVSGFGAVFTDVDLANTTSIQYFTPGNASLGTFPVPAIVGSETLSFLGVSFNAGEQVGRVRITNGNIALGAGITDQNGNTRDVVVMDDFLYSEPRAVPEPASMMLVTMGVLSAIVGRSLRRRIRMQ